MIPAPPGLTARYKHQAKNTYWTRRRVVAFDEDWQPLVVSDEHRLEYASRYGNFDGITDHVDPDNDNYTAIIPADGWRVEFTDSNGSKLDEPLMGWALKNGNVVPLTVDSDGVVEEVDNPGGSYRVYHPSQRETPAEGAVPVAHAEEARP